MPRDGTHIEAQSHLKPKIASVAFFCRACDHKITHSDFAITMNGAHERVVFNPVGRLFRIVTFRQATGIIPTGMACGDFSWFKGYDWRIGLCRYCGQHLGWMFEGPSHPQIFFGLIRPLLTEKAE